jgi:hypothetical protein
MRSKFAEFWRRSQTWSTAKQIAFALGCILVAAIVAGAISAILHPETSRHTALAPATTGLQPSSSTTAAAPRTPTSSTATTTQALPRSTTHHTTTTTTTRRPTLSATTAVPAHAKQARRLIPLTIAPTSHEPSYNRDADFGTWIDADHDCQNTRAEVLVAESQGPVTFTTGRDCTVKTGRWTDPWSQTTTTIAHDFDIDHTVPLANAWRSGAWAWTPAQRLAYANDLTDRDHLIAIDASENRSKGDSGPEEWKPPKPTSWCRYALDWDHIKTKWHLSATTAEWAALVVMARTC